MCLLSYNLVINWWAPVYLIFVFYLIFQFLRENVKKKFPLWLLFTEIASFFFDCVSLYILSLCSWLQKGLYRSLSSWWGILIRTTLLFQNYSPLFCYSNLNGWKQCAFNLSYLAFHISFQSKTYPYHTLGTFGLLVCQLLSPLHIACSPFELLWDCHWVFWLWLGPLCLGTFIVLSY